ncbi:MAG: 2-hydroxyglutaryl-CoA dehydratase [Candidatus Marinimicrobia bacterium]|nr:2-hydroxyglutaryl-CoA dehydratase [Candidatus Neomarinimicrobiota bacterium]
MVDLYFAGVDVGSLSTDVVIIDVSGKVLSEVVIPTGVNGSEAAENAFNSALGLAKLTRESIVAVTATGYGRASVAFATGKTTEISCHGVGAHHLFPKTGTVIDIGGQDSKVIQVDSQGRMLDFTMNDKCAAGTGRFLEVMATRLELDLDELSSPLNISGESAPISSTCTVFAESEVISLLAKHTPREHIVHGLQRSIVNRIWSMVASIGIEGEVTLTGGVANNQGLVKLLEEKLGLPLNIPENPQTVGALGAAQIACRKY